MSYHEYKSKIKSPDKAVQESFIGTKWGLLTVIAKSNKRTSTYVLYECECDCGGKKLSTMTRLKSGRNISCGCKRFSGLKNAIDASKTHEMSKTATYKTWQSMRQRCENPNSDQYPNYGGRGLSVCSRWSKFENFLEDMGERPKGKTIDRINSNDGYHPANCRWASNKTQSNNRRNSVKVKVFDEWLSVRDAAESLGMTVSGIRHRYRRGSMEVRNEYSD